MGTSTLLRYCEKRRIRHTVLWGGKKKKAPKKSKDATKHFGQTLHRPIILSFFWPCGWIYVFFTSSHVSICTPAACRPHVSSSGGLFGMCVYNYITISHKMSSQSVRLRFFLLLFLLIWLNRFCNSKRFDRPGRDRIPRFPLCRALQPRKLMTWSHDPRRSDTRKTDRIVDRERRGELLARLLKPIGIRFVLILQHSHKELTTGCKKNM